MVNPFKIPSQYKHAPSPPTPKKKLGKMPIRVVALGVDLRIACLAVECLFGIKYYRREQGRRFTPDAALHILARFRTFLLQSPYFQTFMVSRNRFQGMNSASLCGLEGQYDTVKCPKFDTLFGENIFFLLIFFGDPPSNFLEVCKKS
jgi:hypothetical protein